MTSLQVYKMTAAALGSLLQLELEPVHLVSA